MSERWTLHHGDCLAWLRTLPNESVDAVVTDPPAGIAFMGKQWDHHKGGRAQWVAWLADVMGECLRVLKPGGHALVWSLPRTEHWTACAVEDAGFEIRDAIVHLTAQGWPKSLDVSKAIDADPRAAQWQGWGTALKPAQERWVLARKPLNGTVAENVLAHGTGALNVDGCRVESGASPSIERRERAALCEGMRFIGAEQDGDSHATASKRLAAAERGELTIDSKRANLPAEEEPQLMLEAIGGAR